MADQSLKLPATQTYSLVGGRCGVKLSDAFRSEAREETSGKHIVSRRSPHLTRLEGWMVRRGGHFRPDLFTRRLGIWEWGRRRNGSGRSAELTVCAPAPQVKVARCCWVIVRECFCYWCGWKKRDANGRMNGKWIKWQ